MEDYVAPRQLDASELPAIVDQYRQVGWTIWPLQLVFTGVGGFSWVARRGCGPVPAVGLVLPRLCNDRFADAVLVSCTQRNTIPVHAFLRPKPAGCCM